jgi:hypothetical protein
MTRVWLTRERAVLQGWGPGAGHSATLPNAQHVRAFEARNVLYTGATAVVDPEAVRLAMAAKIPPSGAGADEPHTARGPRHGSRRTELSGSRSLRRRRDV